MKQSSFAIARDVYSKCTPGTREDLLAIRQSNLVITLCLQAEAGNDKAKKSLPVWTPSCAEFKDGIRKVENAIRPTGRIMLDFDQKGHSREILEQCMRLKNEGSWDILLVEESARRGTHVLITCPPNMTTQQIQEQFSAAVGFEADKSLKDIARCIYVVPQDHVLYEDDRLYEMPTQVNLPLKPTPSSTKGNTVDQAPAEPCRLAQPDEKQRQIFELAVRKAGLKIDTLDQVGNRHTSLLAILSIGITRLIPEPEMRGIVAEYMPQYYANEADCSQLLTDYYIKYTNTNAPMSRALRDIVAKCQMMKSIDSEDAADDEEPLLVLPPLPDKLPPLIEHLTSNVDDYYKPTVAQAVFPSLGAHLLNVTFPYVDNVEHEATLMNVLMAQTGSGKSCINSPINCIMEDIRDRDRISMDIERQWKDSMSVKGANEKGIKRPNDIIIQEIDPNITNQALLVRIRGAQGRFIYSQMNEIELLDGLKLNSYTNNQHQIICLAFDPDNQYGQTRVAYNAVTERVKVRFNWSASSTIGKTRKYFRDVLTDGPVSRINFCTIPPRPIGSPIPEYGIYDKEFRQKLRPYILCLNSAVGRIHCKESHEMVRRMLEEDRNIAIINNDRTYENLSYRANVIAYLKAMVLYVAHGQQWSKEIEEFAVWSKRYDMAVKMHYFGHDIDMAETELSKVKKTRSSSSILAELDETFTLDDLIKIIEKRGSLTPAQQLIKVWRSRGLIDDGGEPGTYRKN